MNKNKWITILLTAAMSFSSIPVAFAADSISVTVDGQTVTFSDQQPVNINGRVMVPIREVAEKMGWEVDWFTYYGNTIVNGKFQEEHDIVLRKKVEKNDDFSAGYQSNINMERQTIMNSIDGATPYQTAENPVTVPLKVINGRTLFGIRDIAECTYSNIEWDGTNQTVKITTNPIEQFPNYDDVLKYIAEYKGIVNEQAESQKEQKKQEEVTAIEETQVVDKILELVNEERKNAGIEPLKLDGTLAKAAQVRAEEITQKWGHTRPDGQDPRTAVYEIDKTYKTKSISENISSWYSPETVVYGWMNSTKGHKENMLNSKWKYAGVGYEDYHWVMMFSD